MVLQDSLKSLARQDNDFFLNQHHINIKCMFRAFVFEALLLSLFEKGWTQLENVTSEMSVHHSPFLTTLVVLVTYIASAMISQI